jgi:hypothetical protein
MAGERFGKSAFSAGRVAVNGYDDFFHVGLVFPGSKDNELLPTFSKPPQVRRFLPF